uniref:Coiled-coil domain-containing protein 63 n=1 Tax=Heterorhabditis bacteriophora TaxID=37862 RepID=A0A1I7XIN1_HETBA
MNLSQTELLSEMESLHGQIDHLSKEIIRSPERVLAELDEQRKIILRTKENCNVERRRIMDIMDKIQLSQQVSKAIDQLWEDVQALLQFKNQLDMRQVEAADYERAADEAERKLKQLTESVKVAEQNSLDAINNHKRAKEMHEARRQQLSKRCEDLNWYIRLINNLIFFASLFPSNLANLTMQGKDIRDEGRILQKELVAVKNKKGDALRKAKAECKNLTDRFKLLAEKHREERSLYNSAVKKFNIVLSSIESGMELDELTVANLSQTFHKMEADHC